MSTNPLPDPPYPNGRKSLRDLLSNQLDLIKSSIHEDGAIDPMVKEDLQELIERCRADIFAADEGDFSIAECVHRLGFDMYQLLGASFHSTWVRQWILLDLKIEAHLRLNGLETAVKNIYGHPFSKAV